MIVAGETVVHGYLRSPRIALDDERNRVDRTASVANPAPAENPAAADHHAVDGVADVGRTAARTHSATTPRREPDAIIAMSPSGTIDAV
jgi:hypothetical protein